MHRLLALTVLGSAWLFTACGGSDGTNTECVTGGSGTLQVNVSGLPASTSGKVTVSGPGGAQELTGTQTLTLASGSYTVTTGIVADSHPLVRTAYRADASPSPVCVKDGQSAQVAVAYAPIASSGKLWTSNGPGGSAPLLGFAADLLGSSGSPNATVAATTGGSDGSAFDREGNLWVVGATTADPPVLRLPASSLGTSGKKDADISLTGGPLEGGFPRARALAFDASGNLWVSVVFNNKIVRYTPDQLAASGSPTPAVQISGLDGPAGLAFDTAGNLWVAFGGADRVARYNASRLTASTSDSPDLVIEAKTPPPVINDLSAPSGLAFDASGNLWVNYNGTLARLTPADQAGSSSASLTPTVQVGLSVTALPDGLLFDESGNLWLALSAGQFGRLGPSQLTSSGSKTPEVFITSPDVGYAGWFSIYPAPANLPLYHRLP
jgi:sugar lactone lactonase YvrE